MLCGGGAQGGCGRPRALIPVFPGTNCEYDTARALRRAGRGAGDFRRAQPDERGGQREPGGAGEPLVSCQMMVIPGGFSGGDEPDGSGKLITRLFPQPAAERRRARAALWAGRAHTGHLQRFPGLIKLGLVPFGRIVDTDRSCPTLTYNRHRPPPEPAGAHARGLQQESLAVPLPRGGYTHRAGLARRGEIRLLTGAARAAGGQRADSLPVRRGGRRATMDIRFNPNGSVLAIEAITSPDGGSWARWPTRRGRRIRSTGTCRGTSTSPYLRAEWTISKSEGDLSVRRAH